jgi:hypothetical protein
VASSATTLRCACVMARFEDALMADCHRSLRVPEICNAIGVSAAQLAERLPRAAWHESGCAFAFASALAGKLHAAKAWFTETAGDFRFCIPSGWLDRDAESCFATLARRRMLIL